MSKIAILEVFEGIPDQRRKQGTRHSLALCLALFTLAVVAGNHGFLAIGDWLKSHNVRDVTFGEDKSRIRTGFLPHILAIARNLAINLYRDAGFKNMAQAKRKCQFDLKHVLSLFRMK